MKRRPNAFAIFSKAILSAFICAASIELMSAKSPNSEQLHQIQQQIQQIQNNFAIKINNLENRLKITIEAERRNKDKTKSLSGPDYDILYRRFEDKKEHIKEMEKYHSINAQNIAKKTKDSAKEWGLEKEFSAFELSLSKSASAFVAQIAEYKKRLETLSKTQNSSKANSVYKEKMEWIVREFDNEYEDILLDTYDTFITKAEGILGTK